MLIKEKQLGMLQKYRSWKGWNNKALLSK